MTISAYQLEHFYLIDMIYWRQAPEGPGLFILNKADCLEVVEVYEENNNHDDLFVNFGTFATSLDDVDGVWYRIC